MGFKQLLSVFVVLVVCIIALSSLTACSEIGLGPDELLSPPKPTGDMYPIQRALEKNVDGKFKLVYPTSGEYRSAFVLADLKNLGSKDYAFAFYSTGTDTAAVMHINVIRKIKNEWISVSDSPFTASGVDKVMFGDLDGDGTEEVIVGWNIYSNVEQQVVVYGLSGNDLVQRMQETYTDFICTDLNEDKKNELFVLNLDTAKKISTAQTFTLTGNGISQDGSCSLDGTVISYSTPILSKLPNNQPAVYVDAVKGTGMITELVYLKDGALTAPFYNAATQQTTMTQRDTSVACFDINGDGKLEIPILEILFGTQLSESDRVYMTKWCSYNGGSLVPTLYTIINYVDGYYIVLPPRLVGKTTVIKRTESRLRIFNLWDKKLNGMTNELMRICVVSQSDWEKENNDYPGYVEIRRSDGFVYAALISNYKGPEAVTIEELKEMFHFID